MKPPRIHRVSYEPPRRNYIWVYIRGVLFAQFVLFGTWNRSDYSYVSWVMHAPHFTALMGVAGIALFILHVMLLRIAYVALGYPGIFAASVFLAALMLMAWQLRLIDLDMLTGRYEFWLFITASIISIGVGWAKYQQRLSGQRDVLKSPP